MDEVSLYDLVKDVFPDAEEKENVATEEITMGEAANILEAE